jgi:hypothetical protein
MSECLVLVCVYNENKDVILLQPERQTDNGNKIDNRNCKKRLFHTRCQKKR